MSGAAVDRHDDDDYCVPEACQRPPQWDCFDFLACFTRRYSHVSLERIS